MNVPRFTVPTIRAACFALTTLGCVAWAQGSLIVTEAMSSSGGGGTADWFEITNNGGSAVNITGHTMDDSSNAFGSSVALLGVTSIAAGESAVFLESSAPGTDVPAFRSFWDATNLLAGVQIGSYSGSGVSLSSAGDGVVVFDSGGATVAPLASFGAATSGASFGYNPDTQVFGGVSVAGQHGAFLSSNATPQNVGSPGLIPEPSTLVLIALGIAGMPLFARRRAHTALRRRRK